MGDVEFAGEWVRYVCAFCAEPTDDDPRYVHLTVDWAYTGEAQALGAHGACLEASLHPSVPLLGG